MHATGFACRKLLLYLLSGFFAVFTSNAQHADDHLHDSRQADARKIGRFTALAFTPNRGQIVDDQGSLRPDILYKASAGGATVYVFADRISYVFETAIGDMEAVRKCDFDPENPAVKAAHIKGHRVDMELVGSNPTPHVLEAEAADGYTNFYLGHCPDGIMRVPSFQTLVVQGVYPNIDMVLRGGEGGSLKCDFVVLPGGNPMDIRMRYVGGDAPRLIEGGLLQVDNSVGFIQEDAPFTYQPEMPYGPMPWYNPGAESREISSSWHLEGDVVRFTVGDYDRARPLVIDPYRKWATYYGANGAEFLTGSDITEVDRTGNVLITGGTQNGTFPTSTGAFQTTVAGGLDIIIVKLKYDGTRLWATLYGGGPGTGFNNGDLAHAVTTDEYRNVLVGGHSESSSFPTSTGAHQTSIAGGRDAVIIKLDSTGARRWATYCGGGGTDDGYGFAIDSSASPAIVGYTKSGTGIATSGGFDNTINGGDDGFLVKFDSGGVRQWGTYYGGTGFENAWAAATDRNDNITIAGWTNSTNLPVSTGAFQSGYSANFDGFVAQFNSTGTRRWATYYGGTGWDYVDINSGVGFTPLPTTGYGSLASDGAGNIFYGGSTSSATFPVTTGSVQTLYGGGSYDATIVKFDTAGNRVWAAFHGGSGTDRAHGVASNNSGGVLLTGETTSANMPLTAGAYAFANAGGTDAFVVKINAAGNTRQYATYYGGGGNDVAEGISFDPFGSIVFGGETGSNPFPTLAPYQGTYGGSTDAFLVLFCDIEGSEIDTSGPTTICQGDSVMLFVRSGYASYLWSTGESDSSITVKTPGTYWVELTNPAGCLARSDTIQVRLFDRPDPVLTPTASPVRLCEGDTVRLDVGPRNYRKYTWYLDANLTNLYRSGVGTPYRSLTVRDSGTFRVIVEDTTGCLDTTATVTVVKYARPTPVSISPPNLTFCEGTNGLLSASRAPAVGESYIWIGGSNPGGGQTFSPDKSGSYQLRVQNAAGCFVLSNIVNVTMHKRNPPPIFNPTSTICRGDTAFLSTFTSYQSYRWSTGDTTNTTKSWSGGAITLTIIDSNGCEQTSTTNVTVIEKPAPRIFAPNLDICEGDTATLDAGFGYAEYLWSNGATGQTIRVMDSGYYYCKVRSSVAICYGYSDTVHVTLKPKPRGAISGPVAACVGTISNYVFPGTAGATYRWQVTGGGGGTITSGAATDSTTVQWGATSGTASVRITVTGSNGCVFDTTLRVDVGASLAPNIVGNRSLNLCPGDSVTLDAGSGYDTYEWLDPRGTRISTIRTITVLDSGIYTVRVSKGTCSGQSVVTVRQVDPPVPVISIVSGDTVICPGGTVVLDGGPYASWQWSPASAGTGRRIVVSDSGVFQVRVVDANGCAGVSAPVRVRIAQPPKPVVNGPASACVNSTASYATVDQPGSTYNWSVTPAVNGTIVSGQGTNSITVNWTTAGSGIVTVEQTSTATQCSGTSDPLFVTISDQLTPTITTSTGSTVICDGGSVTLRGPSGFTSYTWTDNTTGATIGTDDSVVVSATGTYKLDVASGPCSGSALIDISSKPPVVPTITPGGPASICEGDSLLLQGSPGFARYRWSTGDTTESILVKASGSYTLTVIDADGCQGTSSPAAVTVSPLPSATLTSSGDTLIATGGTTYRWFRNGALIAGESNDRLVARENGKFSVEVIDANGCRATAGPIDISAGASATFTIREYQAAPGERVSIPIEMSDAVNLERNGIKTFSGTIRFNRTLLAPIDPNVTLTDAGDDRLLAFNGTIPQDAVTGGTLTSLNFIAALGDRQQTPLAIEAIDFAEGSVATSLVNGLFKLSGLCVDGGTRLIDASGATVLRPVRPNPASGAAEIEYETVEDGRTRIYLVDVVGRRIGIVDADIMAGRYIAPFDASRLNSGTYVCVMETPTQRLHTLLRVEK